MDRRSFLKLLLSGAAVAATPKIFIDLAPAWQRRESGLYTPDGVDFTDPEYTQLFKRMYGKYAEHLYATESPLFTGLVKKYDFTGRETRIPFGSRLRQ